ncbi:MAG: VanZ family protein [Clostridia bacterium]|nr:VanZ family protein [Clostridia bacterium]
MKNLLEKLPGYNRKTLPLLISAVVVIVFIWTQSVISISDSAWESGWITDHILNPIFGLFGFSVSDMFTRKLAHFSEYAVLGLLISPLFNRKPTMCLYASLTVAFIDESIQILAKRGPSIIDVWIDLSGALVGFLIACAVYRSKRRKQRRLEAAETGNAGSDAEKGSD